MKEIEKYTDVVRLGKSTTAGVLQIGDYITITEKLDGANASFCLDLDNELGVSCYSRNTPLNEENRLRGFYDYVINNIIPIKDELNPNYRYYGEHLVSHKVQYKPEAYYKFYMFSIFDEESHMYLSDEIVKSEAERLNIKTIPYLYEGEYVSFEHLMGFVGKSDLTLEPNTGEGIVVKNVDYIDGYGRQMFVKLVSEGFAEVQKQKLPKNPNVDCVLLEKINSVVTKARVCKLLHRFVDENLIQEDYSIECMGCYIKEYGEQDI